MPKACAIYFSLSSSIIYFQSRTKNTLQYMGGGVRAEANVTYDCLGNLAIQQFSNQLINFC